MGYENYGNANRYGNIHVSGMTKLANNNNPQPPPSPSSNNDEKSQKNENSNNLVHRDSSNTLSEQE